MLHCVHIFVGKEYVKLLENLGKSVMYRQDIAEYNHFYNFVGEGSGNVSFHKLNIKQTEDDCEISWDVNDTINKDALPDYWSDKIFDKVLNISNAAQNELYVFVHVPLYKSNSLELVKELCSSINKSARPVNVDFIVYCEDLFKLLEPNSQEKIIPAKQSVAFVKEMYKDLNYTSHQNNMIVIQNRTMNGFSLLNEDDGPKPFYDMIANLSLLFSSHYDKIFSSINNTSRDVVGIGFSSLYFDRYLFADYLLHKTMLSAIDNQSVNEKDVDVNRAKAKSAEILNGKENILSKFFIENIKSNNGADFDLIKNEVKEVYDRTLKYFNDDNDKNMTAKAAVLAYALSKTECELFSSSFNSVNNKCYEDLYKESIDYFIREDDVAYFKMKNEKQEDERPKNYIEELKEVNRTLIQTETFVRDLEEEIEDYKDQMEKNDKVQECFVDDGYFTFDNKKFRLLPNVDEEPLSENYEPHEVGITSVDLRSKFSSVKDQGQQGSCLSFTLTSIFEYMMKIGKREDCNLSAAFLYYTARHLDENESVVNDNGSRFHPSIKALTQYGIPLEKYCRNDSAYDTKPSDEAYKDAETRKLIKALNVECNVKDIKSALADGYPVAGSFTLYPSFNQNGAYIQMPTQNEIDDADACEKERHSCHAMTIVGFSDDLQMFLVRNSWGERWGDDGYCYIPYSYIEDKKLFNFACIITEIASLDIKKGELKEVPAMKINNSDTLVKYYIALASLKKQSKKLKDLKNQKLNLLKYIELQKKMYSDANSRDGFVKANENNIEKNNRELEAENKRLEDEKADITKKIGKVKKVTIIISTLLAIVTIVLFICIKKYMILLVGLGLLIAILPIVIYIVIYGKWINKTKELQNKIDRNKATIDENKNRIALFRNKAFAAWTAITSLSECQSELEQIYTKLVSRINNLREWYRQDIFADMNFNSCFPNITLLDKNLLDVYFEEVLRNSQVCNIDLCADITNHQISADYLSEYQNNLKRELKDRLLSHIDTTVSFNISEHVANDEFSNLSKPTDMKMIDDWQRQANVFVHVRSNERPMLIPNNIVFAHDYSTYSNKLYGKLSKIQPSFEEYDDKYKMTMLSIIALSFEECVVFQ